MQQETYHFSVIRWLCLRTLATEMVQTWLRRGNGSSRDRVNYKEVVDSHSFSCFNFNIQFIGKGTKSNVNPTVASAKQARNKKFRELVVKSSVNITLPQSGNLTDHLRNLTRCSGFKTLCFFISLVFTTEQRQYHI